MSDSTNANPSASSFANGNNKNHNLSCLKIAHSNINSIRHKLDSIHIELSEYDILCIAETKLNDGYPTPQLEIEGYKTPYRKDRAYNNGGGLLIYVKNNVCSIRRQDLENNYCENIWLEIRSLKSRFLLGLFYRPPNSSAEYWDHFDSNIESASDLNNDIIIMGDFNQDMLQINVNNQLNRIMTKYNLKNIITSPTRITSSSQTCLDLILTNHNSIINNYEILPPFNSDHCTVMAEITYKTYKSLAYKKTIWKFDEANTEAIDNKFESTDWSFIQTLNNINIINEKFTDTIMDTCNQYIPKISYTIRPNDKPWMNNIIRKLIRQRDRLYTKAKTKNTELHWQNYKSKRNKVVDEIRNAKKEYLQNLKNSLADESLPTKKWFKVASDITKMKNKNNPTSPITSNDCINIHPLDKAETLNKHFANISKTSNEPQLPDETLPNFNLDSIRVTEQDVLDQIKLLNTNKPSGPDELLPKLIKLTSKYLIKPLQLLYNRSIELGTVPIQWKMANISSIFKGKGEEHDPTNYRPISVTSCLGKMLEKIIFKYLYNYLQEYEILTRYQSGFRPRDSTVNQLLEIYHIIMENLDKGKKH